MANFIDPNTGKRYTVATHCMSFQGGKVIYKDGKTGEILVGEDGITPLELIPKEVGEEGYRVNIIRNEGNLDDRYQRTANHFNKRAEEYNKSDDVKEKKFKAVEREMGTSIAKTDLEMQERVKKAKK